MLLLPFFLLTGCGASSEVVVGQLAGSELALGAVRTPDGLRAYLCGGETTVDTHSRWLSGPLNADGAFSLEADGFALVGDWGGDVLQATLTDPDGAALTVEAAAPEGDGGLFEADDGEQNTAVVVFSWVDDTITAQGASCTAARCAQVIIIPPGGDAGSTSLTVEVEGETQTVTRL